uniref:Myeloid-derived growth factor n=1 Tax=Xiphophorus couchianus TaxID=32473 RepID=A0A3B5KZU5_9TELE
MQLFGKMSLLLLGLSVSLCVSAEQTKVVEFNVKPGGVVHTFSERISEYECIFTYASQGGTNEQWLMSVGLSEDDQMFSCSVWRPQGKSYLFFTQFKAELKGAKIEYANAFTPAVIHSPFLIPVTQRDGKFSAQLSKLTVIGRTRHDEL